VFLISGGERLMEKGSSSGRRVGSTVKKFSSCMPRRDRAGGDDHLRDRKNGGEQEGSRNWWRHRAEGWREPGWKWREAREAVAYTNPPKIEKG